MKPYILRGQMADFVNCGSPFPRKGRFCGSEKVFIKTFIKIFRAGLAGQRLKIFIKILKPCPRGETRNPYIFEAINFFTKKTPSPPGGNRVGNRGGNRGGNLVKMQKRVSPPVSPPGKNRGGFPPRFSPGGAEFDPVFPPGENPVEWISKRK